MGDNLKMLASLSMEKASVLRTDTAGLRRFKSCRQHTPFLQILNALLYRPTYIIGRRYIPQTPKYIPCSYLITIGGDI